MKEIIYSLFSILIFFINVDNSISFNNLLFVPLALLFFMYFYKKCDVLKSKWISLLAFIFSLVMVIGNSLEVSKSFSLIFKSNINLIYSILSIVGYFIFFKYLLSYFYLVLKKAKFGNIKSIFDDHPFISSFVILLLFYLIYMIAFYPAILSPDPSNQIKQFFHMHTKYLDSVILLDSNVTFTNHHPIFQTLLMGWFIKLGLLFNNFNLGLFFYTFTQSLFLIFTLSLTISYMKKIGISSIYRTIVLLFYAFTPVFPLYGMSMVKDVYFACFIIIYTILLFDVIKNGEISLKNMFYIIIVSIFLILFRNNGIYVLVLSIPFLALVLKKYIKKIAVIFIIILSFNFSYNKIVLPYFKIPAGSIREMLSIPFQQTARYVSKYSVSSDEKEAIDKILVFDDLASRYRSDLSDPVKEKFNKYYTKADLIKYFKVWFMEGIKHPDTYIEATLLNTYGYLYPNTSNWYIYYKYDKKLSDAGFDYHYNSLTDLRDMLSKYGVKYPSIPVIGMSVNIGFCGMLLLTFLIFLLYEKKYKYIIVLLPSLVVLLVCFASPANTYFRYAMPYIFMMPLLISFISYFLKDKSMI